MQGVVEEERLLGSYNLKDEICSRGRLIFNDLGQCILWLRHSLSKVDKRPEEQFTLE